MIDRAKFAEWIVINEKRYPARLAPTRIVILVEYTKTYKVGIRNTPEEREEECAVHYSTEPPAIYGQWFERIGSRRVPYKVWCSGYPSNVHEPGKLPYALDEEHLTEGASEAITTRIVATLNRKAAHADQSAKAAARREWHATRDTLIAKRVARAIDKTITPDGTEIRLAVQALRDHEHTRGE